MGLTGNWGARKPRMDGGREMRSGWMFGRYTRNGGYLYLLLWLRAANCNGEQKKMSGRCGRTNHWTMLPLDGGGLNIFFLHHHLEKITSWMICFSQMGWNHQRQFQCLVSSNRFPCWTRFSSGRKLSQCWSRTRRAPFFLVVRLRWMHPRIIFQNVQLKHTKLTLYKLGPLGVIIRYKGLNMELGGPFSCHMSNHCSLGRRPNSFLTTRDWMWF